MEAFISRNKLIWECQAWHHSPLFKPEYGTEADNHKETKQTTKLRTNKGKKKDNHILISIISKEEYLPEKKIPSTHAKATILSANKVELHKMNNEKLLLVYDAKWEKSSKN